MKILYLPFAFLYRLSNIRDAYAAEPEASCQDDHKYTYLDNDEIALTCGEIRDFDETRQELCLIEEVKMHCPFSCGLCCEDNESYIINCDWIKEQGWRKVEYCGQTFEHRMVQEMCPIACDYCMDHVDGTGTTHPTSARSPTSHPVENPNTPSPHGSTKAPSKTPSIVQVPSSSKAPSPHLTPSSKVPTPTTPAPVPKGAVDVTFEYVIPDMCAWVAASTERIERFCGQSSDASAEVFARCPATCTQLESRPNAYPCSDLPDTYTFPALYIDRLRTCNWLTRSQKPATDARRKALYCTPERQLTACAMTCGVCDLAATSRPSLSISPSTSSAPSYRPSRPPSPQPSPFPTLRPTIAPSISNKPSSEPTRDDTPGYLFNRTPDQEEADMVPCEWVCRRNDPFATHRRQEIWCHGDILENCYVSCHAPAGCVSTEPSSIPSPFPTYTPGPTKVDEPFVFFGLEDILSIEKGSISLAWDEPIFSDNETDFDVHYHIFIVEGESEYKFEEQMPDTFVNSTEFDSFRDNFLSNDAHYYAVTSNLDYSFEGTQYNQIHSVLVIAECSEFYSTNRRAYEIIMSAISPVLYEGVVVKGFYFPTELLSISLSDFGDLVFRGPLLEEHLNLRTGEFISGLTSSLEIFFVRIVEVNLIQDDLVYLTVATADPLEEVYEEIHISIQSLLLPEGDDEIVKLQRSILHSPSDIFIGDKNIGILDARSFSSINLHTNSRNLRELYNKEFEFGFSKDDASLKGKFILTITADIEKKVHKGEERKTYTVGYTKEMTVETSIGAELSVNTTFNDKEDEGYAPLWEGTEHAIWVKWVRFVIQPELGGWITFEASLKVKAFYISRTLIDSSSVTISTGGFSTSGGNSKKPSNESDEGKDDKIDFGTEVSGELDITVVLEFSVDVSLYHEAFLKVTPTVTANLNFNAVAELYTFPWRPSNILALSAFDLKFFIGATLSGKSELLEDIYNGGEFGPLDFGEFSPIKIFSLPEVEWTELYTQECIVDEHGKNATIDGIGLKDLGSNETVIPNNLLSNTDSWYVDDVDWDPPIDIDEVDFQIELFKELDEDVLVAPEIKNMKVYAFIKAKIPGDWFLPVVYINDSISVANATCYTEEPSSMPSQLPSKEPSRSPSRVPSDQPSQVPSKEPSRSPSGNPTSSIKPSPTPTTAPFGPTPAPTRAPTPAPTPAPTACADTDGFTWNRPTADGGTAIESCKFVCQNPNMETVNKRQTKWCTDENPDFPEIGAAIKANCCYSCNAGVGCIPITFSGRASVDLTKYGSGTFPLDIKGRLGVTGSWSVEAELRSSIWDPVSIRGSFPFPKVTVTNDSEFAVRTFTTGLELTSKFRFHLVNLRGYFGFTRGFKISATALSYPFVSGIVEGYNKFDIDYLYAQGWAAAIDPLWGPPQALLLALGVRIHISFQLSSAVWAIGSHDCIYADKATISDVQIIFATPRPKEHAFYRNNAFIDWTIIHNNGSFSAELEKAITDGESDAVNGVLGALIKTLVFRVPALYPFHATFYDSIRYPFRESITSDPHPTPVGVPSAEPSPISSGSGPSSTPNHHPSTMPSPLPSGPGPSSSPRPTPSPSRLPSPQPSPFPSLKLIMPSTAPSSSSYLPSSQPSSSPTSPPSRGSSSEPSRQPSPQPSPFPTPHPSPQGPTPPPSCFEDPTYQFLNLLEVLKKCIWIGENLARIERYCIPSRQLHRCPVTCGLCEAPSSNPSDSPSQVPSNAPSRPPSPQPSPFPTSRPSTESALPSDSPSQLPTPIPSPHGPTSVPSKSPTLKPTLSVKPSPVPSPAPFTPTSPPTKTPTKNPSPEPTACDDTDGFTWQRPTSDGGSSTETCEFVCRHQDWDVINQRKDKWCNGEILENCCGSCNAGPECSLCDPEADQVFSYTRQNGIAQTDMCAWVAESTTRIERFCGASTVASAEVFANCPVTCSTLASRSNAKPCSDLPDSYTFPALNNDDTYTCSFLTQSPDDTINQQRKEIYCQPDLQLTACAESCGVCDQALC